VTATQSTTAGAAEGAAEPWARHADAVVAASATDPVAGLTAEEAGRRLAATGPNVIETERSRSLLSSVLAQLRETMIVVLLAAAALTVAIGDLSDAAVILLVIAVNTAVGVVQERRALGAVDALRSLAAPSARVLRSGRVTDVPTATVVPGDVLVLAEGDVVAADARLITADALQVDESLLTGESLPADRSDRPVAPAAPVADRHSMVHGGTLVVHGTGTAVVVATGADSAMGTISTLLTHTAPPATPLQVQLARLGRQLSLIAVVACALVAALGLLDGQPLAVVAVTAVSLAVAAIPESLPAVVTLSLAAAARRMASRGAIVRSLPAVETLGAVTVLASDKTGTLTSGEMRAVAAWTPAAGETDLGGPSAAGSPDAQVRDLLTAAALCSDAAVDGDGGDPTEIAIVLAAAAAGIDVAAERTRHRRIAVVPFDADRRDMTTTHHGPHGTFSVTKGAPEAVIGADDDTGPDDAPATVARRWAASGRRVLAVARVAGGRRTTLGLIAIADPIRPEAAAAVRACREAGITPVLITGDHAGTARAVARATGVIDLHDDEPDARGRDSSDVGPRVYARSDPARKLDLVHGWRGGGHVVAMTGDGVNDAPALKAADIGVAMGRRGTDVARGAADLVLTDDSLATVVSAVAEGRRVFDNIRRFLRYGLSGGAAEILIMLIGPFLGLPLPLLPAQILWVNLVTHGLPGVAIGMEEAEPDVLRRPPRRPGRGVVDGLVARQIAVLAAALVATCLAVALWSRATGGPWQTMLFATLALGQLATAMATRSDHLPAWRVPLRANPMLAPAVAGSVLLVLAGLYLPPLAALLGTDALAAGELAVVVLAAAVPAVVAQVLVLAGRRDTSPGTRSHGTFVPAARR
jgi:Ca2+-transporting ATPase